MILAFCSLLIGIQLFKVAVEILLEDHKQDIRSYQLPFKTPKKISCQKDTASLSLSTEVQDVLWYLLQSYFPVIHTVWFSNSFWRTEYSTVHQTIVKWGYFPENINFLLVLFVPCLSYQTKRLYVPVLLFAVLEYSLGSHLLSLLLTKQANWFFLTSTLHFILYINSYELHLHNFYSYSFQLINMILRSPKLYNMK